MTLDKQRIALPTGVELDVFTAGDPSNPPMIFLHGFPESHRTWRHQMAEFSHDYFCVAPDQRGYAGSDKPGGVAEYKAEKIAADLFALADALNIGGFTLVGHDWGGAIVWLAALQQPRRVEKLIVCNGPHPYIFQRSLFDDMGQRAASQYMSVFRTDTIEQGIAENGLEPLFETFFGAYVEEGVLSADDRADYLAEWSTPGAIVGMLSWYRASTFVVPPVDEMAENMPERPDILGRPFPSIAVPTLLVWGNDDVALLPCQLEGMDEMVDDLTIAKVDAGHFVPWEAPDAMNAAMRDWLGK